jgi:hypothetical protein
MLMFHHLAFILQGLHLLCTPLEDQLLLDHLHLLGNPLKGKVQPLRHPLHKDNHLLSKAPLQLKKKNVPTIEYPLEEVEMIAEEEEEVIETETETEREPGLLKVIETKMIEARTTEAHHHLAVGAGLPLNIAEDHLWIETEKENDGVAISQRVDQAIMVHQKMGVGRLQVVEAEVVPLLLDIGMTTLQDVIEIIGEIEAEAEIDAISLIIILAIILCGTHANMEAIRGEDLLLLLLFLLLACSLVTETEIEIEMINAENESEILNMNMIMNKIAIENMGHQQLKSEKRIFP